MSQTYQTMIDTKKLPSIRDLVSFGEQSPTPQNITEPRLSSPIIKPDLVQRSLPSPEGYSRPLYAPVSRLGDAHFQCKPRHEQEWRSEDWNSPTFSMSTASSGFRSPQESVPATYRGSSSPSTASTVTVRHGPGSGMGSGRSKGDRELLKRNRHMKKERKRRYDIKYETDRLRGVPGCDNTTAKATVYKRSFEYITILEDTLYNMGGSVWADFVNRVTTSSNVWDTDLSRTRISHSADPINITRM